MTTSTSDIPPRGDDGTPPHADRIGLGGPGDLIAALPGLLGFVPEDSLVLVLLGGDSGRQVIASLRQDLPVLLAHPEAVDDLAARLRIMRADEEFNVLAVIVDGAWGGPAEPEACHGWLIVQLLSRVGMAPIDVVGAVVTSGVAAGAPWTELPDGERSGAVPDPQASDVTATHVFHGRTIHGSRSELEELVAPAPRQDREELAAGIDRLAACVQASRASAGPADGRAEFDEVLSAVAAVARGEQPSTDRLARVAVAIGSDGVRDAALGLSVGRNARAARSLWGLLTRALDGRLRAEAAALLAFSAYVAGDGTVAGVAVDAALEARPRHGLARRLDEALSLGLHPDRIRELAEYAIEAGAADGLVVPWRADDGSRAQRAGLSGGRAPISRGRPDH